MWIAISALNLALAVILGAFGAHGLKTRATEAQLTWWQTATDYFFYHALGLLALAILSKVIPQLPIKASFMLIQIGILFLRFAIYHGTWLTTWLRCNYTDWRCIDDCWMVGACLECIKIRKIILF